LLILCRTLPSGNDYKRCERNCKSFLVYSFRLESFFIDRFCREVLFSRAIKKMSKALGDAGKIQLTSTRLLLTSCTEQNPVFHLRILREKSFSTWKTDNKKCLNLFLCFHNRLLVKSYPRKTNFCFPSRPCYIFATSLGCCLRTKNLETSFLTTSGILHLVESQ
jgi:hypothetical protein